MNTSWSHWSLLTATKALEFAGNSGCSTCTDNEIAFMDIASDCIDYAIKAWMSEQ